MNLALRLTSFAAVLLLVAATASRAYAVPLTIANASFEAPAFTDGGYAFLVGVPQQGPHGWTGSDGSFFYNPLGADYTGATANGTPQGALGAQVAGVFGFGDYAMIQRLAGPDASPGNADDPLVDVGTVYTLTFSIGQRAAGNPFGNTWGGYDVQLIAGSAPNTIVLGHEADAVVPAPGQFVTRSFSIISPTIAHPEAFGLPLSILLRKTTVSSTATVEYDNIQLDSLKISPELNANFDELGGVTGTDLASWRSNYGALSVNATHARGNANGDDFVDGDDFLLWQRQLGNPGVKAVPESPTFALAGTAAIAFAARRPRCRSVAI